MRTRDWTQVPEHNRYGMFQTVEHRRQLDHQRRSPELRRLVYEAFVYTRERYGS